MSKSTDQGITFDVYADPGTGFVSANAVDTNEGQEVFRRGKIDAKTFLRAVDEHLRQYVNQVLNDQDANERIRRELERRVEVACKGVQGAIDKMVADEIERQVRARVQAYVATMPISFRLCEGKGANGGEALPE